MTKRRTLAFIMALSMLLSLSLSVGQAEASEITPMFDTLTELTVMLDDSSTQPIRADATVTRWLEEVHNLKLTLEAVPTASYEDKKKVLISTDSMPDVMNISLSDVRQYAREDMFVNLSDYRDQLPNFFAVFDADPNLQKLTVDGSVYSFPVLRMESEYDSIGGQFPVMRMDLLQKHGLEIPTTFDELFDVLVALKAEYPDKIPLVNRKGGSTSGTQKLLETMAYPLGSGYPISSGLGKPYYDEDVDGGRYLYGPANENFKAVLEWLNKAYEAGLLDPDYATNTSDIWKEKMSSGQGLMYFDNSGFRTDFEAALRTLEPEATYEVIPTLTNSLGQTRNRMYDLNWPEQHFVIATSSDNIETALKYFDWAYSYEGGIARGYGVEGITYELVDGQPQMLESAMEAVVSTGTNAPMYDFMSIHGTGLFEFTPYVNIASQEPIVRYTLNAEDLERRLATDAMLNADAGIRADAYDPSLGEEETARYNELIVAVENIFLSEVDKYITGLEPVENWDNVMQRLRDAGATEIEEIWNNANAAYK